MFPGVKKLLKNNCPVPPSPFFLELGDFMGHKSSWVFYVKLQEYHFEELPKAPRKLDISDGLKDTKNLVSLEQNANIEKFEPKQSRKISMEFLKQIPELTSYQACLNPYK